MNKPKQVETGFQIFTEIGIIHQLAKTAVEGSMPDKLRWSHFVVLSHFIRRPQEQSPSHLAAAFQVTNAAMTNTLNKMQKWGYITIRPNPKDSRAKLVCLTDAGKNAHQQTLAAISPLVQNMLADIPAHTLVVLKTTLAELRQQMDAARD